MPPGPTTDTSRRSASRNRGSIGHPDTPNRPVVVPRGTGGGAPRPSRDAPRRAPDHARSDDPPPARHRDRRTVGVGPRPGRVRPVVPFRPPPAHAGRCAHHVCPVWSATDGPVTRDPPRPRRDPERPFGDHRSRPPRPVAAPVAHARDVHPPVRHPNRDRDEPDDRFRSRRPARVARQRHRRTPVAPPPAGRPAFCVAVTVRPPRAY
jgi:hypothetical protein